MIVSNDYKPVSEAKELYILTGSTTRDGMSVRPDLMRPNKQGGRLFSSYPAVAAVGRVNSEPRRGSPAAVPHLALLRLDKAIQGLV